MVIKKGDKYEAGGTDAEERGIRWRRTVYITAGEPTQSQKRLIDKMEAGLVKGDWPNDPYNLMHQAEIMGIQFYEEEIRADGKWHRVEDPDVEISLMQTGAL